MKKLIIATILLMSMISLTSAFSYTGMITPQAILQPDLFEELYNLNQNDTNRCYNNPTITCPDGSPYFVLGATVYGTADRIWGTCAAQTVNAGNTSAIATAVVKNTSTTPWYFLISYDATAATLEVSAGNQVKTDLVLDSTNIPLAIVKVISTTNAFQFGVTNFNAAGVTTTVENIACMPHKVTLSRY